MGRKFFVGGNWKMNGNKDEIKQIVDTLNKAALNDNTGMSYFRISAYVTWYIFMK